MPYIPKRFVITFMLSTVMVILHSMRTNMSVAILDTVDILDGADPSDRELSVKELPSFEWTTKDVSLVHAAFYVGYVVFQLPAAWTTTKLPANRLLAAAVLATCVLNVCLPSCFYGGLSLVCAARFLQGLAEAWLFPCAHDLLRRWVAPAERGRLCSLVFTGVYAGGIIGYPLGGVLVQHASWKLVFYINGALGVVWSFIWTFVGYRKPSHHPTIDDRELAHIEMAIAEAGEDNDGVKTPWRSIFSSPPVWALCVAHFARAWVFFLMLTNEPAYLAAFDMDATQNGLVSAIPWLFFLLAATASGPLSDYVRSDAVFTNTFVRKLFTCAGFGVEGAALLSLFFLQNRNAVVVLLSIGIGFGGFTVAGWQINHQDLAPRFAGVLVGLTSTVGNCAGVIAPLVAGALTHVDAADAVIGTVDAEAAALYWRLYLSGWQLTFLVSALVVLSGALIFGVAGSGEMQPWAFGDESRILVVPKSKSTDELFDEEQFKVSKIQQQHQTETSLQQGAEGEDGPLQAGLHLEEEDEINYEEEKERKRQSKASFH